MAFLMHGLSWRLEINKPHSESAGDYGFFIGITFCGGKDSKDGKILPPLKKVHTLQ
jgi:hypothetical protein